MVGLQSWDNEIGSNSKNIAIEFAKHNRVLFVDYPLDRRSIISYKNNPLIAKRIKLLKTKSGNLKEVDKNLWNFFPLCILESCNWLAFTWMFRIVNRINNKRYARQIKLAIKQLGFKDFILFNDNDLFRCYHLQEMLRPALSIYYSRDYLMGVPYWYKHGHKLEPEIIAKSDMVIANSIYLSELAMGKNKHTYYIKQGCDIHNFDYSKVNGVPYDIAIVKSPIIGFVGTINIIRLDIELIEYIAQKRPAWNIVLVGPQDEAFEKSNLHAMENVFFTGVKREELLAGYIAKFDVAINPQKLNDVTVGNYPRKIIEYLAMGKPVVATETSAMQIFSQHVFLANSKESFVQLIEKALMENTDEKTKERTCFANKHTWQNSISEMYSAIADRKPVFNN